MSELIEATRTRIEQNDSVRLAVLAMFTIVLAIAFVALLVSDQVNAAGL